MVKTVKMVSEETQVPLNRPFKNSAVVFLNCSALPSGLYNNHIQYQLQTLDLLQNCPSQTRKTCTYLQPIWVLKIFSIKSGFISTPTIFRRDTHMVYYNNWIITQVILLPLTGRYLRAEIWHSAVASWQPSENNWKFTIFPWNQQNHWHKLTYTFMHTKSAKVKYSPVLYFLKLQRLSVYPPLHWAGLMNAEITNA